MVHRKTKLLGTLLAVLALGIMAAIPAAGSAASLIEEEASTEGTTVTEGSSPAATASPLLESCEGGNECTWSGTSYGGARTETRCEFGVHQVGEKQSAKNRCPDRFVLLLIEENGSFSELACMNPEGNRPNPGKFEAIQVSNQGERCP